MKPVLLHYAGCSTCRKARVDAMSEAEIVDALSRDGKLIKRPVLVAGERVLVGFDPERWAGAGST